MAWRLTQKASEAERVRRAPMRELLCFLALGMVTTSCSAAPEFAAGRWTGTALSTDQRFEECGISAIDRRGTAIRLSVDRTGSWSLHLSNPGWHLPTGRPYHLTLQFDGGPALNWDSRAASLTALDLPIAGDLTIIGLLRQGHALRIRSGSFDQTYDLQDSSAAIDAVSQCHATALIVEAQREADGLASIISVLEAAPAALMPVAPLLAIGTLQALHPTRVESVTAVRTETAPTSKQPPAAPEPERTAPQQYTIGITENGDGTFVVPVDVNGVMTLQFIVDSGAADISIPSDVASTLERTGTIRADDFTGTQTYTLADGSTREQPTFRIHSMKVGDAVLTDVTASVAPANGMLLLGQSFFRRFDGWSIDNGRALLILTPRKSVSLTARSVLGSVSQ